MEEDADLTQQKIEQLIQMLSPGDEKFGDDIVQREYTWHTDSYEGALFPYTEEEKEARSTWDHAAWALVDIGEPAIEPLTKLLPKASRCRRFYIELALERIQAKRIERLTTLAGVCDYSESPKLARVKSHLVKSIQKWLAKFTKASLQKKEALLQK